METELQVVINAAVMAISVADIPQTDGRVRESEETMLKFIPVYEDLDGADYNQTDEIVSLSSDWALTLSTSYAEVVEEQWDEDQNQLLELDPSVCVRNLSVRTPRTMMGWTLMTLLKSNLRSSHVYRESPL